MEIQKITGEDVSVRFNPEELGIIALALMGTEGQETMTEIFETLPAKVESTKSVQQKDREYHDEIRKKWDIREGTRKALRRRAIRRFPGLPPVG